MRPLGLAAVAVLAWLAVAGPLAADAQPDGPALAAERSIKAAYLCKFADYVEWPGASGAAGTPLRIGVLGSAAMADELARITAGRTIAERPVQVRRVGPDEPLDGLDVLFVGEREHARLDALLKPASTLPILTVTESAGALADGSIINFTIDRERVRFEVSLPAAERSRLKLSSRLLAVAQRVQRVAEP